MTRDPRVDPRPGDVVRLGDRSYTVTCVSVYADYVDGDDVWTELDWYTEFQDAEIVKVAE